MFAIAIGMWWNANTVAHNFIHRPFFRHRAANAGVGALLTLLLGFPQSLWRARHLAHHAGVSARVHPSREVVLQTLLVLSLWSAMTMYAPGFFIHAYVPGYAGGLLLCAIHGHYEHAAGTTSHYGRLYNLLLFNDGYHVEHHRHPGESWARLPNWRDTSARTSVWPAPLRWLDAVRVGITLESLERCVLRSSILQRLVLRSHARAFRSLLASIPPARQVAIVGGGLFPRTALVLRELLPDAHITIVDGNRENLERARGFLHTDAVSFVHQHIDNQDVGRVLLDPAPDLIVFPLAFDGDRDAIYADPPAATVIVHDWIWRKRGASRVVSIALLKRMNLVHG